jgi:6-phosphogluconolactonase (cycloisomerase 2 family)
MNVQGCRRFLGGCTAALLLAAAADAQVLTQVDTYTEGVGGLDGLLGPRVVVVSPDGEHVYTAAENDSAIAVFERDHHDGTLTQIQVVFDDQNGVDGIRGTGLLAISPDGRHVYAGAFNFAEREVAVFERDCHTGLLTQVQVVREPADVADGLGFLIWMEVSHDGKNLYVGSASDNAIVVFQRDRDTGLLAYQQIVRDGVGGVNLMTGTIFGALSRDGENLYVVARLDDAIVTFARDEHTGALTLAQELKDGVDGVDGLDGARNVLVSKNGKQVYVVSLFDNSIAVFDRDKHDGTLTFVQKLADGVGGVEGLFAASALAESHNGKYVFVGGFADDAIGVFRRGPHGLLSFVEFIGNGGFGATGLDGVISLAVSPNGKHLYSCSFNEHTVGLFDIGH